MVFVSREGQFFQGSMHGSGFMVDSTTGERQEALMIHNELVCYHNGGLIYNLIDTSNNILLIYNTKYAIF